MPKSCEKCDLEVITDIKGTILTYCSQTKQDTQLDILFDRTKSRHPYCPLGEIKTPHGFLIDRDAIENELGVEDEDIYVSEILFEADIIAEPDYEDYD